MNVILQVLRERRVAFFCVLAAIFTLWILGSHERDKPVDDSPEAADSDGTAAPIVASENIAIRPKPPDVVGDGVSEATNRAGLTHEEKLGAAAQSMNVRVRFWGRVIDQDGLPLSGVKVVAKVRSWKLSLMGVPGAYFSRTEAQTDAAGDFSIDGGHGDVLEIETLQKDGYEPEPRACRDFGYTTLPPFVPDNESPVVLRMWRAGLNARLLSGSYRWALRPDGRSYTVDLQGGVCSESQSTAGDFRVAVTRATNAVHGKRYDWSLAIEAVGGGFREEMDETVAMFQAPVTGYTNEIRVDRPATEPNWSDVTRARRFYLRSRNGQRYARIEIRLFSLYMSDGQARLNLTYAVNAEGGRLLR